MSDELDAGVEEEVLGAGDDEGVETEESLSSEDSEGDTDWKAEFDRVQADLEKTEGERDNYKTALNQKRGLRKKAPTPVVETEEDDSDDDENRPATLADIRKERAQEKVDATLATMVSDPDKRKLVRLYYDTRIRQTGTSDDAIRSDIDAALAIAEAPKLRKTSKELERAAQRDTTPPLGGSGSDRGKDKQNHKFSADQVKVLTDKAKQLGQDPTKFIEQAWKNQQGR